MGTPVEDDHPYHRKLESRLSDVTEKNCTSEKILSLMQEKRLLIFYKTGLFLRLMKNSTNL